MSYPEAALKRHPGANRDRGTLGKRGYFWGIPKSSSKIVRADASRWMPHIGAKQRAKGRA